MAFNNYLEDENDKPYFTTNSLAYYYDKMEGFAKAVEGSAKALNLTKEEIEQRIALRLAEWDKNLETFDGSVEKLLTEWVDDGTLTHVIDSTLIDQKIAPVALQLEATIQEIDVRGVTADKFGAIPDYDPSVGTGTDNSLALQAAINAVDENSTLLLSGKYRVTQPLFVNKPVKIQGLTQDTEIISDFTGTVIQVDLGTILSETTLTESASQTSQLLTVANSQNVGNVIKLTDESRLWPFDERAGLFYGELNEVKNKGTTIELEIPLSSTYPVGTKVTNYQMKRGFSLQNVRITRKARVSNSDIAVQIKNAIDPLIENVIIDGYGNTGVSESQCIRSRHMNVKVFNSFFTGVGLGYGIKVNASIYSEISGSYFQNVRRGVDFSGGVPARFGKVVDCTTKTFISSSDETSGFGTHGTSEYIEFIGCRVFGSYVAFASRGTYATFKDCHAYGTSGYFITIGGGHSVLLDGCRLFKDYTFFNSLFRQSTGFITSASKDFEKGRKNLIVNNCYAEITNWFIYLSAIDGVKLPEVVINNLKVFGANGNTSLIEAPEVPTPREIKLIVNNIDFTTVSTYNPFNPKVNAGVNNMVTVVKNKLEVETVITNKPLYVGQVAVVADIGYMATGTTSATDWKRVTT